MAPSGVGVGVGVGGDDCQHGHGPSQERPSGVHGHGVAREIAGGIMLRPAEASGLEVAKRSTVRVGFSNRSTVRVFFDRCTGSGPSWLSFCPGPVGHAWPHQSGIVLVICEKYKHSADVVNVVKKRHLVISRYKRNHGRVVAESRGNSDLLASERDLCIFIHR